MYTYSGDTSELHAWIRSEVELTGTIEQGATGLAARRIQEWLSLNGFGVSVDGEYGPITGEAVADFQHSCRLPATGRVDATTFDLLTAALRRVVQAQTLLQGGLGSAIVQLARLHLDSDPREIGGENSGPWVRLYMKGNQGHDWLWCAGFATFVMEQACGLLGVTKPIGGSFSCDQLAAQAKAAGKFVAGRDLAGETVPAGSLFLVRNTDTDWTHVGIVEASDPLQITTIEGNTNDDGSREGYEVCRRKRGYTGKDFILLSR